MTRQLDPLDALKRMMFIRAFETALSKRPDHGFQLLSSGEEAVAVGLSSILFPDDQLLTGGRSIGPAIARGIDPGRVMAELLGRVDGVNGGRGGRGHLADPSSGFFGAHAVVGGNISIAAGVALARKLSGDGGIVVALFGDGACGSGSLHETLNMAASWRLPLLFVCNNNQLSVSTARKDALAPAKLSDLGKAFGLPAMTVDGMNVQTVADACGTLAAHVRRGEGPAFLECLSFRLLSHSTTARETRRRDELEKLRTLCPIATQIERLQKMGRLSKSELSLLEEECALKVAEALAYADASPYPDASEVLHNVD